ncbi:Uu.00g090900.m01.CDS01 [Anthostomella pinea]|uniref:Uu.00g090900.m01.CDS01 n=1 Tax=Anthostomella pinea TaxID=933095 RepID=A0AAI8YHX4_9PEZI|nr:Uu.00g090900.m01.CDS01 [Anthostomella pinea]
MAKATRCYVNQRNQQLECHLKGREGLSNWFLLVSLSGAPGLRKAYNDKGVRYKAEDGTDHEGKVFTTNGLAATFVFFDEAHTYRGSLSSPTQPFALLKTITEKSWDPTVAFAISGFISGGGPGQLTNILDHILRVKGEQHEGRPSIGGITNVTELEDKKIDWNYLLQKHHIVRNQKTKDEVNKRKKSIGKLMKNLVPHVLMARRNVDTFRGQTIGDAGREIVAYVRKAFDERHNAWTVDGRRGPEPTQHSVELEFFGGEGAAALKLGKGGGGIWTQLLRANVYPEVARLYLDKLVTEEDLECNNINRHGDEACLLVATDASLNDLQRQLATSPFWPYRTQLIKQSSKFAQFCQYINGMVAYRDRRPGAGDDPGPADSTNIRHMIVLSDTPVSSYITFMLLCVKYPKVKVMLINGRMRKVATEKTPGYGRREMIEDLMSDCTSQSRNKIIVSTYCICGTALSMQRANYYVMLEPACNAKEEAQAAVRVNRRGQCMWPFIVRLHDERNLPETLKCSRHQNQDDMENWQEQGIPWDDFL